MTFLRLLLLSLLVMSSFSYAASPFEQELKDLTSAHNEAIDGATRLIDSHYEKVLVPLMKRAGAAGDVEAAVKIKAALDSLPKGAEKTLIGQWDLRTTTNYTSVITFLPKGKGLNSVSGPFEWKIVGRTLYLGDLEQRPDAFELPVKDGILHGSNRLGNGISMKRKPPEALPSSVKPADDAQVKSKGKPAPQIQRMTASWEEIRKEPAAVEVLKREATAKDLGGALVKGDNREQVVFVKRVEPGERGRLRCNKHDPPFFIVCSNESVD